MRRLIAALLLAVLVAPTAAAADTLEPSQWPPELRLGSAPNAIRFGGVDRYHTALSMTLALRGAGDFPFDTPDRTSAAAPSLAAANGWWGARTCPRSIIVVAGDTPADALAAAPLSDPTNRSDEPRLTRVAAADPLFDPIGGLDRVDTAYAPIIVTASGRSGATSLSPPARLAAQDLTSGGCTTAREAIIVGGGAAVPVGVESELVTLGYGEVFRVAGDDRFDTAARIATALGTEAAPEGGCLDPRSDDGDSRMGFYGNAVIEYRPDASHCELHGRTVVLADGDVGADALAAGWWTSYWQVPVLLVRGDGTLPPATRTALQSVDIDTLVVLGGTGRIPEAVADEAGRLAGAVVGRFSGTDRYETSGIMAQVFGGWYPTGNADDFGGDVLCVAGSIGGASGRGWPDALAAGPWCGRAAAATDLESPARVVPPVESSSGPIAASPRSHDAVPILLTTPGTPTVAEPVHQLLESAFLDDGGWCTAEVTLGCRTPGFAVAFGGSATVAGPALAAVSDALSGTSSSAAAAEPSLAEGFRTALDLSPGFDVLGEGAERVCFERDAVAGARWLARYDDTDLQHFESSLELKRLGIEASTSTSGLPSSRPFCEASDALPDGDAAVVALGVSGQATPVQQLRYDANSTMDLSAAVHDDRPQSTSGPSPDDLGVGRTARWDYADQIAPVTVRDRARTWHATTSTITLYLQRVTDDRVRFQVELTLGGEDALVGTAAGEAVLVRGDWELAGRVQLPGASGGFRGTLVTRGTSDPKDDALTWRIDAAHP